MSTTFRTAVVRTPGGRDSIEIVDVPVVEPGPGQVRVEIAGATVNPVDLAVAAGVFHGLGLIDQPAHTGLGWDFAGTVTAAGPDVDLPVGSRIAGLSARTPSSWSSRRGTPLSCPTASAWPRQPRSRSTAWPRPSWSTSSATVEAGACW